MKFEDLLTLYKGMRQKYGNETYKHISELFSLAKEMHKNDWERRPTPQGDHEQSWRA